jgi:asparagine synthetase B (glutamine-hydrolysing)
MTVVLSGDGGDELFGGFDFTSRTRASSPSTAHRPRRCVASAQMARPACTAPAARTSSVMSAATSRVGIRRHPLFGADEKPALSRPPTCARQSTGRSGTRLARHFDASGSCRSSQMMVRRETTAGRADQDDRMSMAHSIESRAAARRR